MKKSLLITDDQKYGRNSLRPATPSMPGEGGKKEKPVKRGILVELTGPQVDAFCTCSLKPGDTGSATVHYVVKSVSAGEPYGDAMPAKSGPKSVKLLLTHVESEEDDDDESGEDAGEEAKETPEEESSEEKDEPDSPVGPESDRVSPKDAGLDDEE